MEKENMGNKDKELIEIAKSLVEAGEKKVSGGIIKEVGAALLAENGEIYSGVCLHLSCGIGFCAEHSAIAEMVSRSDCTGIKAIVAVNSGGKILSPCGRCRELIMQINKDNLENCEVIISEDKKVKLKELLPETWL